jgi:hypothetical protein
MQIQSGWRAALSQKSQKLLGSMALGNSSDYWPVMMSKAAYSNPHILGHQTNAPVSGFLGYAPSGQCQDFVDFFGPKFEWLAVAR